VSGVALGSSVLELELLPESSPGSFGGGAVGNGCCLAAEDGAVEGAGESGAAGGAFFSPGKGNFSTAVGFSAPEFDEQGFAGFAAFWLDDESDAEHGGGGAESCAGGVCGIARAVVSARAA